MTRASVSVSLLISLDGSEKLGNVTSFDLTDQTTIMLPVGVTPHDEGRSYIYYLNQSGEWTIDDQGAEVSLDEGIVKLANVGKVHCVANLSVLTYLLEKGLVSDFWVEWDASVLSASVTGESWDVVADFLSQSYHFQLVNMVRGAGDSVLLHYRPS